MRAWLLALSLSAVVACGGRNGPGSRDSSEDAVVVFSTKVADAAVWADGRYVSTVENLAGGVALPAGAHRIEIRRDGFHSVYLDLQLRPRERRRMDVDMAEILP